MHPTGSWGSAQSCTNIADELHNARRKSRHLHHLREVSASFISEVIGTEDSRLLDPKVKTYLPAVGGLTIYTFGDARKLKDEKTEVRSREPG